MTTPTDILIVSDRGSDWLHALPEVGVVAARTYLTDPAHGVLAGAGGATPVYNLCRSCRYQSLGYYVSLLAEARGHLPLPDVSAIEDLQSQNLVRLLSADLDDTIQHALGAMAGEGAEMVLEIYFGRSAGAGFGADFNALSRQLFELFQAPLLLARFVRSKQRWQVRSIKSMGASDIPADQHGFAVAAAQAHIAGDAPEPAPPSRPRPLLPLLPHPPRQPRHHLAILRDPNNPLPASNDEAIARFRQAAAELDIRAEVIGHEDIRSLARFDGLFIRDNTFINHYTYRFSRRAAAEGLVVIDDPASILRCNNKVYLAELLPRHRVPVPRTLVVHRGNLRRIIPALGLPCVLKQPDSSLSLGVGKAESADELAALAGALLATSDLIVAQEYLPTEFDWRVGILDRRPLFVCKYFMAPGHWQIIDYGTHGAASGSVDRVEGATVALALADAPAEVIEIALRAANLIGDGFYGVDLKQVGGRLCVIEVNDNPNVDAGNEDGVLQHRLYREVMKVLGRRMGQRRSAAA